MFNVKTTPPAVSERARRRPPARLARIAGVLYLGLVVCSGFAELHVRAGALKEGDAAATAANIASGETMFRLGVVSDLAGITCFLLLAMALYQLLKHVDEEVAKAMVVIVAVAVAILCANLLNHLAALTVATDAPLAAALGDEGSDALALLFLDLHDRGYHIAQVFFGLWLLPLGHLVRRSGYFPRPLGIALMVGGVGYLVDLVVTFTAPSVGRDLTTILTTPADIAELALVAWLLVRGVRTPTVSGGLGHPDPVGSPDVRT